MSNYNSIEGNVLFPTIDGYDMHKAGDMALYLAHCDFYPFKSVIDNNKMAIDSFDAACQQLNREYQKNKNKNEIKSHHYIISFDPRDSTENCLTGKWAQELGLEYAKANFPGHQALVCTHMDGHNGSGNIHVHIVINSLRKLDVPQQPFMERPIDCKAGYKHHVTNEYLKHLQKSLMDLCRREFLHQVDLLSPSRTGVTEVLIWRY